jgi:hypothetical protein
MLIDVDIITSPRFPHVNLAVQQIPTHGLKPSPVAPRVTHHVFTG